MAINEDNANERLERLQLRLQNANLRVQSNIPLQPCTSSVSSSFLSTSTALKRVAALSSLTSFVYSRTPIVSQSLTSPQCWTNPFTFSGHPWMRRLTQPRPYHFSPPLYVLRLCLQISHLYQQLKLTLHSNLYQIVAKYRF